MTHINVKKAQRMFTVYENHLFIILYPRTSKTYLPIGTKLQLTFHWLLEYQYHKYRCAVVTASHTILALLPFYVCVPSNYW